LNPHNKLLDLRSLKMYWLYRTPKEAFKDQNRSKKLRPCNFRPYKKLVKEDFFLLATTKKAQML